MVAQVEHSTGNGLKDEEYSAEEMASMRVYALARASVARISVGGGRGSGAATGSGFLWDREGHIVSNAHVVDGGTKFVAIFLLAQELVLDAALVGLDACRDIAVLRVSADALPASCRPLQAAPRSARVGQRVHVLGAPFGLSHSFTTGVVSAVGREIVVREGRVPLFNTIQTDAAVNTGCSGGPVLSSGGTLLGMTVAIASPNGAFAGVGFAIPWGILRETTAVLIKSRGKRSLPCPALGLSFAPSRVGKSIGLKNGLLVLSALEGSAAKAAGIRGTIVGRSGAVFLGDVLLAVDGVDVRDTVDVWREIWWKRNVGDRVELRIRRQGVGEIIVAVVLKDAHQSGEDAEATEESAEEERTLPRAKL